MTKVLVFGTFDGIHDGHRAMLREAKSLTLRHPEAEGSPVGNYLVAAVAPDSVVKALKGGMQLHTAAQRIGLLKGEHLADEIILADEETHSWKILKKVKPQIVALGYDQDDLRTNLEEYLEKSFPDVETEEGWQSNPKKPKIVVLSAHEPEKYHNRIMNKEL